MLALRALRRRSAAERSWVAHLGIVALIALPIAPLAMPVLGVEAPALISGAQAEPTIVPAVRGVPTPLPIVANMLPQASRFAWPTISAADVAIVAYWLPAAILLGITLLALGRLIALRARASVLVDDRWLTALARAQRRMGFKHGTALLTSDDLPSPISWGMMRPVILLNSRAVAAAHEAEAIIAHELAHVARLDWLMLLIARIATALFWFNPLVWMLAREAHQLREEAADDTVLAADIDDTDYAQLLVGIARHECRGLLIGAHGVAPSRGSLARRIARVLDGTLPRGPARRPFAIGMVAGAVALAAPLAALNLIPPTTPNNPALTRPVSGARLATPAAARPANPSRELASVIGASVASSVQTAMNVVQAAPPVPPAPSVADTGRLSQSIDDRVAAALARAHVGSDFASDGAMHRGGQTPAKLRRAIEMKAIAIDPDYAAAMRAAAPSLAIDNGKLVAMKVVGVTPAYIAGLAGAGYRITDVDDLIQARALGIDAAYIRGLADAGYRHLSLDTLAELRAVGVDGDYVSRLRVAGFSDLSADQLVEMKVTGMRPQAVPRPPRPPRAAAPPAMPD